MSKIEKEYNDRFQNQSLQNDDFDVEGLWEAIEPEIGKKKDRKVLWLFFFGFVLLTSLGIFIFENENNSLDEDFKNEIAEQNLANPNSSLEVTKPKIVTSSISKSKNFENIKKETRASISKKEISKNLNSNTPILNSVRKNEKQNFTQIEDIVNNATPTQLGFPIINTDQPAIKGSDLISKKEENTSEVENKNTKSNISVAPINALPSLVFSRNKKVANLEITPVFTFEKSPINLLSSETPLGTNEEKRKKFNWSASIYYGVNLQNESFDANSNSIFSEQKNASQSGFYGNTFGVKLQTPIYKNWMLASGIEYNNLWSKFDYNAVENIEVPKSNQLLRIEININGDTLNKIFGDTVANAVATRTIVHHNQNTQLTIPLLLGYQKRKNNLLYGISVGGAVNFQLKQSGKALISENEIIEYNSSSIQPKANIGLSFRSNLILGYYLSDKILLSVEPTWMFSRNSFFEQDNVNVSNSVYSLNVGVGYRF